MDNDRKIAVQKQGITYEAEAFNELMSKAESILNKDAKNSPEQYKKLLPSELEECSLEKIKCACENTPFDASDIILVSGQKFPDIIAKKYFGIEVKSTKSNHWTSTGSSIVESTRDVNVKDIYMLFGKLGGQYPEFRCRPYEDVLYDIVVTHSPRYLINMELQEHETIFDKMQTTYNEFRQKPNSIDLVRKYHIEKAKLSGKQDKEMPWWITQENAESPKSLNIRLWQYLSQEEKEDLKVKCMILFPEALNPKSSPTKYNRTTLWLCAYNQVINPNVRDMYSAGGSITYVNGEKLDSPKAQVYKQIVHFAQRIKSILGNPPTELIALLEDYNACLLDQKNLYEGWLQDCERYAAKDNVPLRKWIEEQPEFSLSK